MINTISTGSLAFAFSDGRSDNLKQFPGQLNPVSDLWQWKTLLQNKEKKSSVVECFRDLQLRLHSTATYILKKIAPLTHYFLRSR